MRSGTLYVPQIVGFGEATRIALGEMEREGKRIGELRDRLWQQLSDLPGVHLNGHLTQRLPNNLNISIEGVNGNSLLSAVRKELALSSGSACSSQKATPSHVITALGRKKSLAAATLRYGLGKNTGVEDIDTAILVFSQAIAALRG